jgi:rhamnosyltransferase
MRNSVSTSLSGVDPISKFPCRPNDSQAGMLVGLVIPTLNAGGHVDRMLRAIGSQTLRPARFLVIDSSSRDDTAARFREAGAEIRTIAREDFDHGATRQMAVDALADMDIIIFLTQDAIPADPQAFRNLIAPFHDSRTCLTYGRQLPSPGAGPIGAHARLYNYPDRSDARRLADAARLGIKTVFCSNSFAAYRRDALQRVGGFPAVTIFGEDTQAAAKLIRDGGIVRYVADARVYHSHDYRMTEEFRRYFDIGVLHGTSPDLLESFGGAEGEGLRFVQSELRYLREHAAHLIPASLIRTALKYGGYRVGRLSAILPDALNRCLSLNRGYWGKPRAGAEAETALDASTGRPR